MPPKTMFEKIWHDHVVVQEPGEPAVIYIDLHLVHEVTSPQAPSPAVSALIASFEPHSSEIPAWTQSRYDLRRAPP